jgi:serine protease Do
MKQITAHLLGLLLLALSIPGHSADFSKLFESVNSAVVVIKTEEQGPKLPGKGRRKTTAKGLGSGVFISADGLILTAAHVVDTADNIEVVLLDERVRRAEVVASLSAADIAIIQLLDPPEDLPFIELGDSDKVKTGAQVFVIGSPYGLEHSLTVGYLSGRRFMKDTPFGDMEFLQTDAAINMGNSGGPMFNLKGQIIGIVSHIKSQSGGNEGLGFAASINMARELLLESPPVWLGANFIMLNEDMAAALNAGQKSGLLVQKVARGSMADKLGLKPGYIPARIGGVQIMLGGDIITNINDNEVSDSHSGVRRLMSEFRRVQPGDPLVIQAIRRGDQIELSATTE